MVENDKIFDIYDQIRSIFDQIPTIFKLNGLLRFKSGHNLIDFVTRVKIQLQILIEKVDKTLFEYNLKQISASC